MQSEVLGVFLMLAGALPTAAQAAQHALLIGVSDYSSSGLPNLPGAKNDVARMEGVLKQRFGFSGTQDSITTLLDAQATHRGIAQAFTTLKDKVRAGDQVFVYYSGHGSQTQDRNGDEPYGKDQTWVSYGARSKDKAKDDLDRYDVLDDQINDWLGQLGEKTGEMVVFVSDSCHSATVSRGDVTVRAAPPADSTDHPLASQKFPSHPSTRILSIGAARDDQSALEMSFDNGVKHGLFTWYWSQSLAQAEPSESWQQVFDRTRVWMNLKFNEAQHPQLSGKGKDAAILGGLFLPRRDLVPVKQVSDKTVTLEVGRLTGATVGSVYESTREGQTAKVTLTEVNTSYSLGTLAEGQIKEGDFLKETHHAFPGSVQRVYVNGDAPAEQAELLAQLRALFPAPNESAAEGQLPGFERTDRQDNAHLIVYALQPKRNVRGEWVYKDRLPDRDPQAGVEIWVLNPNEQLLHERMRIAMANQHEGLRVLKANLLRYRRTLAITELAQSSSTPASIAVRVIVHDRCEPKQDGCMEPGAPTEGRWYRKEGQPMDMSAVVDRPWKPFDLVSFRFENSGPGEAYLYLYELRDDGSVAAIYPDRTMPADSARIPAGKFMATAGQDVYWLIDKPGSFAFFTVVSRQSLNHFLVLEQEAYESRTRTGTPPSFSPLEQLLVSTVHGTRGERVGVKNGDWSTQMTRYTVSAPSP